MSDPEHVSDPRSLPGGRRLESWKEIAAYLRRDVRTVQRWERRERLPVHRHHHAALASVHAFSDEIDAWRLRRAECPSAVGPSLPTSAAEPLVGRRPELARLHECFTSAATGRRKLIFISGEAGVGKTALLRSFLEHLTPDGWFAEGGCVEEYGHTEPFWPVLDALGRLVKGPYARQATAVLERTAPSWLHFVRLGGGTKSGSAPTDAISGDRQAGELLAAVQGLAEVRPLALVLENLHWADHATVSLLARWASRRESARVLVVGTYRPENLSEAHPGFWRAYQEMRAHFLCETLELSRFEQQTVAEFLALRGAWTDLEGATAWFHARTDGNPLFLVHLVLHLTAQGLIQEHGGLRHLNMSARVQAAVPETLRDLIGVAVARLDLSSQQLLEVASVAGRHFSSRLVARALERSVEDVERALDALARRQHFVETCGPLPFPDGTEGTGYRLVHQFFREVLYDRIPSAQRATLHRRMAEELERAYGQQMSDIALELAIHFDRGHQSARAIPLYEAAAERAFARGGLLDAQVALTNALRLLPHMSDADRGERERRLRVRLCSTLAATHSMVDPLVQTAYAQLHDLGRRNGSVSEVVSGLLGVARVQCFSGKVSAAVETSVRASELARAAGVGMLGTLAQQAVPLMTQGAYRASLKIADSALTSRTDDLEVLRSQGYDSAINALNIRAWNCWALGRYAELNRTIDRMLAHATEREEYFSLAVANGWGAPLLEYIGEPERAAASIRTASRLASGHRLSQIVWWVNAVSAWMMARRGQATPAVAELRQSIETLEAVGLRVWLVWVFAWLAEALLSAGLPDDAAEAASEGVRRGRAMGAHCYEAELLRLKGEALTSLADHRHAQAAFQEAIAVADSQGALTFTLRASIGLARSSGPQGDARRLLEGVLARFGDERSPDLRDARELLALRV
ncbi:MAG: AAA family ATPase [Vicinamibacterales bacterium]